VAKLLLDHFKIERMTTIAEEKSTYQNQSERFLLGAKTKCGASALMLVCPLPDKGLRHSPQLIFLYFAGADDRMLLLPLIQAVTVSSCLLLPFRREKK